MSQEYFQGRPDRLCIDLPSNSEANRIIRRDITNQPTTAEQRRRERLRLSTCARRARANNHCPETHNERVHTRRERVIETQSALRLEQVDLFRTQIPDAMEIENENTQQPTNTVANVRGWSGNSRVTHTRTGGMRVLQTNFEYGSTSRRANNATLADSGDVDNDVISEEQLCINATTG